MAKLKSKTSSKKQEFSCPRCFSLFKKYPSQLSVTNPFCSRSCARKMQTPYMRTPEHKKLMSRRISSIPRHIQRATFLKINKQRKGKTFFEIYGKEKAIELLKLYSERMIGKKNFNYIDGRSFLPYPTSFNKILKMRTKQYDNFKCARCGMTEDEARKIDSLGRGLTIHHIDFNKNNCRESNLITTCRRDNSWANWHKEEAIEFFQNKIKERMIYVE